MSERHGHFVGMVCCSRETASFTTPELQIRVLDPSTYLSDRLLWPQSGWPRCQLFAPQCLDLWRKSNSRPTAHSLEKQNCAQSERRVRLRTPTCCPRHCRMASLLNQDPSCLRSRLRLDSWRRSDSIGKPKTPVCTRTPPHLFLSDYDSCNPTAGRRQRT